MVMPAKPPVKSCPDCNAQMVAVSKLVGLPVVVPGAINMGEYHEAVLYLCVQCGLFRPYSAKVLRGEPLT